MRELKHKKNEGKEKWTIIQQSNINLYRLRQTDTELSQLQSSYKKSVVDSLDTISKKRKALEDKKKKLEISRQQLFAKHGITASTIDEGKKQEERKRNRKREWCLWEWKLIYIFFLLFL